MGHMLIAADESTEMIGSAYVHAIQTCIHCLYYWGHLQCGSLTAAH